jgi:hypothetical protein
LEIAVGKIANGIVALGGTKMMTAYYFVEAITASEAND